MGVYIKGMEMPTNDDMAPTAVWVYPNGYAIVFKNNGKMQQYTQAVPVPPHGDLIDVEGFLATQRERYCENCERRKGMKNGKMRFVYDVGDAPCRACDIIDVLYALEDAPTIIPASEEGE